ncbi:MAG TPA: hypothetical protein VJ484_11500 [Lysobacter sp.]|nr:hypothetical protein [Lysobacter sp.]
MYGVPLATKSIQPVWIEVENHDDRVYCLMSPGLDPNFFPASEVAEAFMPGDSRATRTAPGIAIHSTWWSMGAIDDRGLERVLRLL